MSGIRARIAPGHLALWWQVWSFGLVLYELFTGSQELFASRGHSQWHKVEELKTWEVLACTLESIMCVMMQGPLDEQLDRILVNANDLANDIKNQVEFDMQFKYLLTENHRFGSTRPIWWRNVCRMKPQGCPISKRFQQPFLAFGTYSA